MKLLVTGAAGLLGSDLVRLGRERGDEVVGLTRADLDVTDAAAVAARIAAVRPAAVVNCAAFTDVDGAEAREAEATRVNGEGAGNVARGAAAAGAVLVHVGSDYVFPGAERRPRREDDPVAPRSAYGRSKLAGENAVAAAGGETLVVRSAWLYGRHGKNFVDTIRRKCREEPLLRVVDDQIGSPTWSVSLAEAILDLLAARARGTVHFANLGAVSWYDLARAVVAEVGSAAEVRPISTGELGRPAARPAYSALDPGRFTALAGRAPSDWRLALGRYLRGEERDGGGAAAVEHRRSKEEVNAR